MTRIGRLYTLLQGVYNMYYYNYNRIARYNIQDTNHVHSAWCNMAVRICRLLYKVIVGKVHIHKQHTEILA